MITSIPDILSLLHAHQIEFIVIGGVAASMHGSARATFDLDVVYRRTSDNITRLVTALAPHSPYLRGDRACLSSSIRQPLSAASTSR